MTRLWRVQLRRLDPSSNSLNELGIRCKVKGEGKDWKAQRKKDAGGNDVVYMQGRSQISWVAKKMCVTEDATVAGGKPGFAIQMVA